jgi:predicted ArsR family transcriptional regulator
MEGSILALLAEHESLGFDQIVAHLGKAADAVRHALQDLRDGGFITVLSIGDTQGHVAAASYWRLTDKGRQELARRGSREAS